MWDMPSPCDSGWYAIRVNFLYGLPGPAPVGGGAWKWVSHDAFSEFRSRDPDGQADYSIALYFVPPGLGRVRPVPPDRGVHSD